MKHAALILATLALAAAASTGAGAQQQTFWTMKAAPSIPPTPSAQPVYPYINYKGCGQAAKRGANGSKGKQSQQCGSRRPSPRPSMLPHPRSTQ